MSLAKRTKAVGGFLVIRKHEATQHFATMMPQITTWTAPPPFPNLLNYMVNTSSRSHHVSPNNRPEIAFLRESVQQLQNSLVTTQAAKDVLMEITKLVKSGKSVTNAAITLRSKGKIKQHRKTGRDLSEEGEETNFSSKDVSVALEGIVSYFTGAAGFDSSAAKASVSRLKKVVKEQAEASNDHESQIEVKIGIGHLG